MTAVATRGSRLRVVLLTAVFTVTGLGLDAAPLTPSAPADRERPASAPLPFGLGPAPVNAAYCASNPAFTGKLTQTLQNSGTPPTVAGITSPTVYGWISNVDAAWSCTLYRRYSGLAWNTTSAAGVFRWGTIINSTSVSCNWVVGSTDYLKANGSTICPSSDTAQAMSVTLTKERVYVNNVAHSAEGHFSFAHSDCATTPYYGAALTKGSEGSPVTFGTSSGTNRPGTNCDPITLDGMGTSQTVTYDATAPSTAFDWPTAAGPTVITSAFAGVQFDATDAIAGFAGANDWDLQRQKATWSGSACGTFASDTTAGHLTSGTTNALDQVVSQSLADNTCYRWTLAAVDANGNTAALKTSGIIRTDLTANLGQQSQHTFESWDLGAGDALSVNVGTGNLVLSHPIVSLPIRGSSLDIGLTYNRHDTTNVGMGPGWRLNLHRRLALNGDGSVTFTDADGSRHRFTVLSTSGTVTTYTRPHTLYAMLVKDTAISANEFILTYRNQSKDKFDIAGSEAILVREEDRHGNGVDLTYVAGTTRISKVRDTAASPAREIDFAYDGSNRVASITDWAYWTTVDGTPTIGTTATGTRRAHRFFYDGPGNLAGWAEPPNTAGSCPTGGSHLTCLTYAATQFDITKTQTVTTIGGSPLALGETTRPVTTRVTFSGSDVTNVKDAEEVFTSGAGTSFSHPAIGTTQVVRRGNGSASLDTTTRYGLVTATDAHGRVASVKRKLGTAWIERLTSWNPTYPIEPASITDNNGALLSTPARTTSFTYVASSMGLVARMTEPLDGTYTRWTDYTYNANNDVTQTIVSRQGDADLRTTTRHCYATSGCATNATDLLLRSTIENYTDGTPQTNRWHDQDVTTSYQYDDGNDTYGQQTRVTRQNYASGGTLLDLRADGSVYDDRGNLTASITNYVNGTVTNPGDDITPNATTRARTDLTTAYTYDTAGNQASVADPRRAIRSATGPAPGIDDYITRSTYDLLGRRVTETTPATPDIANTLRTAKTRYDELGHIRNATDFGGRVTATEYDRAGRAIRTFEDPDGAGSTPAAVTGTTTYDPSGRVLTVKDREQAKPGSTLGATTTSYDELGRATVVAEADGTTLVSKTATAYDALDRQTCQQIGYTTGACDDPSSGQATLTTHDLGGRVTKTDDEFTCATSTYDYRNLALTETTGLTGMACASGANTRTITHSYDGLARLTRSEVTAGTGTGDRTVDATFDSAGRTLTAAVRTAGVTTTTTFTTNPLDEIVTEARPDGSTAKTAYDPAGNSSDRCYWKPGITVGACNPQGTTPWTNPPTQVTTSLYDARNSRVELRDSATDTVTTYDPDHNYQPLAFYVPTASGKEHQTIYGYDARHRLTSITQRLCVISSGHNCSSTTSTGSNTYAYDDNDNRTTVVEHNGATNTDRRYCYDARNQLRARQTAAACTTTSGDETYTFDAAGNRLTAPGQAFTYNSAGQLTGCTVTCGTITYDTAGNTARLKGWSYEYDSEGRLVRACKAANCTGSPDKVEFTYDGEGHRTQTREYTAGVLTTTRDFRYQGDAIIEESTNGVVSRGYMVDEAGRIIRVCDPSCASPTTSYLVIWNGHGDATALYRINGDGTLTLANSYKYSTWGEPETTTLNGIADLGFRFLYVGHFGVQWDDFSGLGLHYMHARHYSPLTGRFLQPDPSAAEANLYAYAENSPVTKVDPQGLAVPLCGIPFVFVICVAVARTIATWVVRLAVSLLRSRLATVPRVTRTMTENMRKIANPAAKSRAWQQAHQKFQNLITKVSQCHHIFPKYMGGPVDGPGVRLNAAYHQLITNRFRELWAHSQGHPPTWQALMIMLQVYMEIPIDGFAPCNPRR